jgi:hypothetical protein
VVICDVSARPGADPWRRGRAGAAEAEEERRRKERYARIIVLKWTGTSTDYKNEVVQRNIRSRIARPDALFFPEVDLYQNGRKLRDRTVIPANQPAIVGDDAAPQLLAAVNEISQIAWDQIRPDEWGLRAQDLRELTELIWFVDRVELREPMFLLYAQIGRAAYNYDTAAPPFFDNIGGFNVNYYWYLAATLAYQEPALMSKLTDQELAGSIQYYLQQLQSGSFPTIKVDFEQENQFEEDFNDNYEILMNGLPVELDDNAQIDIFLGRTDIYLKRKDAGHGLSERLEVTKLEDRIYFVRDVARKRMGVDFIEQLFLYKNECTPDVDGDILNYLAIYARLHEQAEIYIAVPEKGNPNRVYIWRYDRSSAQLSLVGGGSDDFPVRFAFLFSSGLLYNGAAVTYTEPSAEQAEGIDAGSVLGVSLGDAAGLIDADLAPALIPLNLELRAHYNRLMVNFGAEFGYGVTDGGELQGTGNDTGTLVEYYQHPGNKDAIAVENPSRSCTSDGNELSCDEVYNIRDFNRYLYMGAGVVLGRDAGIGFGPRFAGRFGWSNIPHGLQTTAHFGWAFQPPIPQAAGRVRPLLDADLRGGVAIARDRSLQRDLSDATKADNDEDNDEGYVMPVFGLTVGLGLTF